MIGGRVTAKHPEPSKRLSGAPYRRRVLSQRICPGTCVGNRDMHLFSSSHPALLMSYGTKTRRKPMVSKR